MTRLLVAMVVVLLAALGWQWGRADSAGRRADAAEVQLRVERSARKEEAKARAEEARRVHRIQEAQDAEFIARRAAEADARRADAAAVSLRKRVAELTAAAREASERAGASDRCETAHATINLLADMLRWTDEAAGEVGRYADQAGSAGRLCVSAYQALTPTEGVTP